MQLFWASASKTSIDMQRWLCPDRLMAAKITNSQKDVLNLSSPKSQLPISH